MKVDLPFERYASWCWRKDHCDGQEEYCLLEMFECALYSVAEGGAWISVGYGKEP